MQSLLREADQAKNRGNWLLAKAGLGYLYGKKVIGLSEVLGVTRGSANRSLQWNQAMGAEGLRGAERPWPTPRLPSYSSEFNPTEGAWNVTPKIAIHTRFYPTTGERDGALVRTFRTFQSRPSLIADHGARY